MIKPLLICPNARNAVYAFLLARLVQLILQKFIRPMIRNATVVPNVLLFANLVLSTKSNQKTINYPRSTTSASAAVIAELLVHITQ
jgi:hypothetical protein